MNPRDLETASQFVKLLRVLSDPKGVAKTIADIEAATNEYKKTKAIVDTIEAAQAEASKIMSVVDQEKQTVAADKDLFARTMTIQLQDVSKREADVGAREELVNIREDQANAKDAELFKREEALHDALFEYQAKVDSLAVEKAKHQADVAAFEDKLTKFQSLVGK